MAAIRDYYRKEEEYLAKVAELDAVTEKRDASHAQFEVRNTMPRTYLIV